MVANRVLLELKCGRNVSRRGARRYPSIMKTLVRSFFSIMEPFRFSLQEESCTVTYVTRVTSGD